MFSVIIAGFPASRYHCQEKRQCERGKLISSARRTEDDHCESNKALTCFPEKTTPGSPPCLELEK